MPAILKRALRSLRNTPSFTVVAIAVLALGIGATTAMFSITRTILLQPLAYHDPEQLDSILIQVPALAQRYPAIPVNALHYRLWRDHARTLRSAAAVGPATHILSGAGAPERTTGVRVSANLFEVLGVQPRLGRAFLPNEDQEGHNRVVVISDGLWRTRLGARTDALGRKILLDGTPYEVIGVMPVSFQFPRSRQVSDVMPLPERTDFFTPLVFNKDDLSGPASNFNYLVIARTRPGVSTAQVIADLRGLESVYTAQMPPGIQIVAVVKPLQEAMTGQVRRPLLVLLAAVGLVLLIVCINLMNLMLVRGSQRRRERAVRLAMGAGARDLIREAMAESVLLSVAGAALGSLAAVWLLQVVRTRAPMDLPRIEELGLDPFGLAFALGISVMCAILFGLWPALRTARVDPQEILQASGRSSTEDRKGLHGRSALICAEVALSTVLLLGAGLLLRSFTRVVQVNPGFEVQHLLTARIQLPPDKFTKNEQSIAFYEELARRAQAMPGVRAAAMVSTLPVTQDEDVNPVADADRPLPPMAEQPITNLRSATGSYFQTAGIPLLAGRTFNNGDRAGASVILTDNLAARLWPGQSALGRWVVRFGNKRRFQVVGVVGSVHTSSLTERPGMMAYFPLGDEMSNSMALVLRTAADPRTAAGSVRRLVSGLDSQVAVSDVRSMGEVVAQSYAQRRFQLILLAGFAGSALILACLGIYGVLSFSVTRRIPEIGIRMALGARPAQVLGRMLQSGMAPVAAGLVLGLVLSALLGGVVRSLLFGVTPLDPLTWCGAAGSLLTAAALACWWPARRAARLNPVEALRRQ